MNVCRTCTRTASGCHLLARVVWVASMKAVALAAFFVAPAMAAEPPPRAPAPTAAATQKAGPSGPQPAGPLATQAQQPLRVQDRIRERSAVRVCIWPTYYGISFRNPRTQALVGLDIDLSAEFGKDLGVRVEYVDSSFATLIDDLKADRCDVAMFAVGMLPQRLEQLRFTRPYLQSGIYAVTTKSNRAVRTWRDIDQPGVLVAVQAGTFMEPVMAAELKKARLVSISPPATRERELEAGRVDVFMTDYPYSRRLLDNADWATLISPPQNFHVLPYAYAVKPGDDAWLKQVDDFVARIQSDGRLEASARRHRLSEIVVR